MHDAICAVCRKRIGIGIVSSDVAYMAIMIHTNCLPNFMSKYSALFRLNNRSFTINCISEEVE